MALHRARREKRARLNYFTSSIRDLQLQMQASLRYLALTNHLYKLNPVLILMLSLLSEKKIIFAYSQVPKGSQKKR